MSSKDLMDFDSVRDMEGWSQVLNVVRDVDNNMSIRFCSPLYT